MTNTLPQSACAVQCRLLTPRGVGALAVVRLSGAQAWSLARGAVGPDRPLPAAPNVGRVHFASIHDQQGLVDAVLLAARVDPYDGTPVVDICCHGGRRVVERVLLGLAERGAAVEPDGVRPSGDTWPGMLLRQVDEAVAEARTHRAVRFLLAQRDALIEAFDAVLRDIQANDVGGARQRLRSLLDASPGAHWLVKPAEVGFVGPPNVGKSALVNRLGGRDGAIVSDQAGTTRDWVAVDAAFAGVPVTLIDTAGHRRGGDALEQEAIAAGERRARLADVVVLVVEATATAGEIRRQIEGCRPRRPGLVACNKVDLAGGNPGVASGVWEDVPVIAVSAHVGTGVEALKAAILGRMGVSASDAEDALPAVFDPGLRARLAAHLAAPRGEADAELAALWRAIGGNTG